MMNEYSVCQFFADGTHEYVCRFVSAGEAMAAFSASTRNGSAQIGITERVIVTDSGDSINRAWEHGKGIVFPPPEAEGSA